MWERPWWDFVGPIDVDLFRTQVVVVAVVVLHLRKPNQTEKSPSDRERQREKRSEAKRDVEIWTKEVERLKDEF